MRKIIIILFLLSAINIVSTVAQNALTIIDSKNIRECQIRPNTHYSISKRPDKKFGYCGKLVYDKYQSGNEQWPGIIWKGKAIKQKNWNIFSKLKMFVYSPEEQLFVFHIKYKKADKTMSKNIKLHLHKGNNPLSLSTAELLIDLHEIQEIHFFLTKPDSIKTFYIGNLLGIKKNFVKKIRDFNNKYNKLSPKSFANLSPAEKNIALKLYVQLRKIKGNIRRTPFTKIDNLLKELNEGNSLYQKILCYKDKSDFLKFKRSDKIAAAWLPPTEKVFQTKQNFNSPLDKNAHIALAQNEREAMQLVLLPQTDMKNIQVKIIDTPQNAQGKIIPERFVKISPIGFVFCSKPPYKVNRTGYMPDPVMEFCSKADLTAQKYQPYLLQIRTDKNTKSGIYKGNIEISADGIKPIILPFSVEVFNFALPDGTPYPQALSRSATFLKSKKTPECSLTPAKYHRKTMEFYVDHRISPDNIYRKTAVSVTEAKQILKNKGGIFNIIYVNIHESDAGSAKVKSYVKHILKELAIAVPKYRKAGILDKAYIYAFDEAKPKLAKTVKYVLQQLKAKYPNIPVMTTLADNTYGKIFGITDLVDIWVPFSSVIPNSEFYRNQAWKRGQKVWWYTCINPAPPYANFFIENLTIDSRLLMGMMMWKYKVDGYLYYAMGMWRKYKQKPNGKWIITGMRNSYISGVPLTNWKGSSFENYNGDGNLIYPAKEGPIPSIRFINMVDGLEDYFYLKLLKDALKTANSNEHTMSEKWLRQARKALKAPERLVKTLTVYNKSYIELNKERIAIARLLEEFYKVKSK